MAAEAPTQVAFNAEMVCEGCSSAITRILSKVDGVDINKIECDMPNQKVIVSALDGKTLDPNLMLEKLKKWGEAANKKVELAE